MTQPEMDTSEIYRRAIEAVGAKRLAPALGMSLGHLYRLARPTMDVDPDGTGARSDLDRLETLIDLLAARPAGRPVLVQIRYWVTATIDRALGAWRGQPLTRDGLAQETAVVLREFAELVAQCCPDGFDRRRIVKEGAEAIAAIEHLMDAAREGMESEDRDVVLARRLVG